MLKFNLIQTYLPFILDNGGNVSERSGRLTDQWLGLFHGDPVFNSSATLVNRSASCQSRFPAISVRFVWPRNFQLRSGQVTYLLLFFNMISKFIDCFFSFLLDSVRLLKYSLDESEIRSQDSVAVIDSIAHNPKGRLLAWKFVQDNYNELYKRYPYSVINILHFVLYQKCSFCKIH